MTIPLTSSKVSVISSDEFSTLLSKYNVDQAGDLLLKRLEKKTNCNLDVPQIISQNFYIQCALCEMLFTGNIHASFSVPSAAFCPDEYCTVFRDVVLLSIQQDYITCEVRTPVLAAIHSLVGRTSSGFLHPLLQSGLSYFQKNGGIPHDYQPVFLKYNLSDDIDISNDLLITSAEAWRHTGLIIIPIYMPLAEIEKCRLIAGYNKYFDDFVLVGHVSSEKLICHSAVCLIER